MMKRITFVFAWAVCASALAAKVDPQLKAEMEPLLKSFVSTSDKSEQPLYFWAPENAKERAVPLLVGLHTWSGDITQQKHYAGPLHEAKRRGWAFVGSNFRGPNWTPLGCGSDAAVQDIVDAVAYAQRQVKVDSKRIYIAGASGGGHMALLMAGRHPEIFAAAAALCPPAELARWHREMTTLPRLAKYPYGNHLVKACGGTPAEKMSEYLHRSATTHLKNARAAGVAIYIETGIHDGWIGSVPDGHAIRAFNELADEPDRLSEETIAFIEQNQKVPETLAFAGRNPFYSEKNRVHFRRTSANAVLTIFEGGHGGNWASAYDFLSRQEKGRKADFTVPEKACGKVEALYK